MKYLMRIKIFLILQMMLFLPFVLTAGENAILVDEEGKVGINIDDNDVIPADVDVELKGKVNIDGTLSFNVLSEHPSNPREGSVYVNTDGNLYLFLNGEWKTLGGGSTPPPVEPIFRIKEYYLSTGDFSGTSHDLILDQDLAADYFVLVRGSRTGTGGSYPDNNYVRLAAVPGGKGDLLASPAANQITLTRHVADLDWEGVITVVECLSEQGTKGFTLVDAVETDLVGTTGTDTLSTPWTDINQVVLFGGFKGAGAELMAPTGSYNHGVSVFTRLYPSGSDTINWTRNTAGETLVDARMTTLVVEWGSEWNIQQVNVAGSAGANGANQTGHYVTTPINSVSRANTWVWGTGTRADAGIGDNSEACLVTLGDGVNQNTDETTVAVGSEYNDAFDFDIYTMTHSSLSVSYHFKADADSAETDVTVTVPTTTDPTKRFSWVTNGVNGTGTAHPREIFWARYTTDSTIMISRGYTGQTFPAWVQGIDLSAIE